MTPGAIIYIRCRVLFVPTTPTLGWSRVVVVAPAGEDGTVCDDTAYYVSPDNIITLAQMRQTVERKYARPDRLRPQ